MVAPFKLTHQQHAPIAVHNCGTGGFNRVHGSVPLRRMWRRKTLSPAVTYSICMSGPANVGSGGSKTKQDDSGGSDEARHGEHATPATLLSLAHHVGP